MEKSKQLLQVLGGLDHRTAEAGPDGPGDHARGGGTFLTGVRLRKSATDVRAGVSIDQVLALLALILFWKASPTIRLYLGIAFVLYVLVDVMTFGYFYPRNDIMFKTAPLTDIALLKKTWAEWNMMNWVRSAVVLCGLIFSFIGLDRIYLLK